MTIFRVKLLIDVKLLCLYSFSVRWIKNVFILLLALAWAPMTSHCSLEKIPGLEFLACKGSASTSDSKSHCEGSTCCAFENSGDRTLSSKVSCPPPPLIAFICNSLLLHEASLRDELFVAVITSPPELSVSWLFISRTALPVRAPSLVS